MLVDKSKTILHLSDLHFSTKYDEPTQSNRELLLQGLLDKISSIESDWQPNIVCLSGDIVDKADADGFKLASVWLKKLSAILQISFDKFIVCPGNHDGVRDVQICAPFVPKNADEADKILIPQIPDYLKNRFIDYSVFCKELGIPSYKIGEYDSYLIGSREIDGIQFIVCNTAWFSFEKEEESKLWLGLNLLKYLEQHNQLVSGDTSPNNKLTIAIMHHGTETYFHEQEKQNHDGRRPPTLHYLWKRCHAALYGHSHENAIGEPNKMQAHCWTIRAGATNAGADHPNNINLIRINSTGFELRRIEYNPAHTGLPWVQGQEAKFYSWENIVGLHGLETKFQKEKVEEEKLILRQRVIEYSTDVIKLKSRQIKPHGSLPEQISLQVVVKPEKDIEINRWITDTGKSRLLYLPIDEAFSKSRLNLLLGDLGAGKSTILAKYALIIGEHIPKCMPIFIPARRLKVNIQDGITELLDLLHNFIKSELTPGKSYTLENIIDDGYEIILLIDGLDEIDKSSAVCLIRLLTRLPMLYSRVSIVLSSRLTEILGIDYDKWQLCQVPSLSFEQKETLLRSEAIAQGKDHKEAAILARRAINTLKANPLLNAIANSPLAIRLLYKPLIIDLPNSQERTLGDLLYELLIQRLGEWVETDLKISPMLLFEQTFPTPESKATVLGELAFRTFHNSLSKADATAVIKKYIPQDMPMDVNLITKQALNFFEINGIITSEEPIEFIYQPLAQIAAGVYLSEKTLKNEIEPQAIQPNLWRIISFTGTMIRRLKRIDESREWFSRFIKMLLKTRNDIAPACYIASELRDEIIAQRIIDILPSIGRRPLWYLENERGASVLAIAHTLILAGDKGFEWLFTEYLDPMIPPTNTGSALIRDLFTKWSLLVSEHLSSTQKSQLIKLVNPLQETEPLGTFGFLENLAYLVPEAFELGQFLWLCVSKLDSDDFSQWAKSRFKQYYAQEKKLVNAILERKSSKAGAILWLELNPEEKPSERIVKTILSAKIHVVSSDNDINKAIIECRNRIGNEQWKHLLRWFLTDASNELAASVALELIEQDEKSLYLLGTALAKGLMNMGIGCKTESTLKDLISISKTTEINWPKFLFNEDSQRIGGASPGCWRIFLDNLKEGVENGPELLLNNISQIGFFNISRYPEICLGFRDLMSDSNGQEYRKALRAALNHYDPQTRQAVAMVLIACYPQEEGLALVTAVAFIGLDTYYWEWEKFLITLNFGPSVLDTLKASLSTFSGESRIVALALLAHGSIVLEEDEKRELILKSTNWRTYYIDSIDLGDCNLSSEFAFGLLLQELNSRPFADCADIAKALLGHHGPKLPPDDKTKCFIAAYGNDFSSIGTLLGLFLNDKDFVDSIKRLRLSTPSKELPQLFNYFLDPNGNLNINWDEIIWNIFCSDRINLTHGEDDVGLGLMWLGQEQPEIGQAIGQTAIKHLDDERIQKHRWTNHYHWLAVLADRFIGLEKVKLNDIVCVGNSLYGSATYSLLGRLGEVPSNFCSRDKHHSIPEDLFDEGESLTPDVIYKRLIDVARESEWLKSGISELITRAILSLDLSQNFLDELASKGKNGSLLAGVLAYCYGLEIKADYALLFNDYYGTAEQKNSTDFERLNRVSTLSHAAVIRLNENAKNEYLSKLLAEVKRADYNNNLYIFEILRIQKDLTLEQVNYLLPLFAGNKYGGGMDSRIVSILSLWVINLSDQTIKDELINICKKCINDLDRLSWEANSINYRDPSVYLCFSLMYWFAGGESDQISSRVFARGIKLMFDNKDSRSPKDLFQQNQVIKSVGALIQSVPKHVLKESLTQLTNFPVPEVRIWVTLFGCFM